MWSLLTASYLSGLFLDGCLRDGIRVYCYHGVVESKADSRLERNFHRLSDFRDHLRFLSRFRVLSLAEIHDRLSTPGKQRKPAVAITFDDGYANNLLAAELLSDFNLPWAVFVSTGNIDQERTIPLVELSLLLLHGNALKLEALGHTFPLRSDEERAEAFQAIRKKLKTVPSTVRRVSMDHIAHQFPDGEIERLLNKFPSLRLMSWEQTRRLADSGVEIGSHGVDHEIHHNAQPRAVRIHELTESRVELEARLDRSCRFFAFPNGNYGKSSSSEVKNAGYELAFTTRAGTVVPGADQFLLPRLDPPASLTGLTRDFFWSSRRQKADLHLQTAV
ncbi:MAG: polysaccharide deacetylase family protein [Verrucomicrobiota bacterium]